MKKVILTSLFALAVILNAQTQIAFQQLEYVAEPRDLIEIKEVNLVDEGKAQPVLKLSIQSGEANLKMGDEVPIIFTITSEGSMPYHYTDRGYDRSGRMEEYGLYATDEHGQAVGDPRAAWRGGIGGGIASQAILGQGESFKKTIALNRWAILDKPGSYQVIGRYRTDTSVVVSAQPINISLQPRSDSEMTAHIKELSIRLKGAEEANARATLVRKLMYTHDTRVVPTLIEELYKPNGGNFWVVEAFRYYLPDDDEINTALFRAAEERGLRGGMLSILKQRGINAEEIRSTIELSLSPDKPAAWPEAALAAQQYPDDRFIPRLIAIAIDPESGARDQAIYALALNRTDQSVAILRELLQEPAPPGFRGGGTIQRTTESAIRSAYRYRGNTVGGRILRSDDFDAKYQRPSESSSE